MGTLELEILIAIAGTFAAILALYQQGHASQRTLGLTVLRTCSLVVILVSGGLTLRTLSVKRADVLRERSKAMELQSRLEGATTTVDQLGQRLQAALAENVKLLATIDSMREDLASLRASIANGALAPQHVASKIGDQLWHDDTIILRLRSGGDSRYEWGILDANNQLTDCFDTERFRNSSRTASVTLINVRSSDMLLPTFRILGADVASERTSREFWVDGVIKRLGAYSGSFAHGDVVTIQPAGDPKVLFWVSVDDPNFSAAQFLKRNPNAAIRIQVR